MYNKTRNKTKKNDSDKLFQKTKMYFICIIDIFFFLIFLYNKIQSIFELWTVNQFFDFV